MGVCLPSSSCCYSFSFCRLWNRFHVSQAGYVAKDDLELVTLLCSPPCLVYLVLETEPRASSMPDQTSALPTELYLQSCFYFFATGSQVSRACFKLITLLRTALNWSACFYLISARVTEGCKPHTPLKQKRARVKHSTPAEGNGT